MIYFQTQSRQLSRPNSRLMPLLQGRTNPVRLYRGVHLKALEVYNRTCVQLRSDSYRRFAPKPRACVDIELGLGMHAGHRINVAYRGSIQFAYNPDHQPKSHPLIYADRILC